jgi:hypothetical protein
MYDLGGLSQDVDWVLVSVHLSTLSYGH